MRIALVNSIRFLGGGERRTLRAAREYARRGHSVTVLGLPDGELAARCRDEEIPFAPVRLGHYLSPAGAVSLARALAKTEPDVAVCYDERAARVAALAAPARLPLVYYLGLQGSFKNKPFNRRLVAPRIARFVANAEATRQELLSFGWIPERRLRVIYNGVDPAPIEAADPTGVREALGAGPDELAALVVARLVPEKGHAFLLDALAFLPERAGLTVWIAGEGPETERLQAQSEALGLSRRVRFLGFRSDVPRLMRAADLLIHPSRREGAPNSVREAMVAGLPVVAVAGSGTPEVVAHGETGLLSPVGDGPAFCEHLQAVLRDADLRRRLGEAGRHRALTEFSEERCAEQWLSLLSECMEERRRAAARSDSL